MTIAAKISAGSFLSDAWNARAVPWNAVCTLAGPLLVRHGIAQAKKGRLLRYVCALPLTILLVVAWTCGEAWGTLTKRA